MTQPQVNPALNAITSSLFRVSAKLLVIQDSKLLVVKEDQGWYGLPGGGVDHGEDIIEGLVREISEEVGQIINHSDVNPTPVIVNSIGLFDGIPRLTLVYTQVSEAPAIAPNHSELTYAWVSPDEFSSLALAPNIAPMREAILRILAR